MKALSLALQAHLDEGTTTLSWCWRITRTDGVAFGFTDHDQTLNFDGTEFEPESGLTASEVRSGSDLSVDAQDAEGVLTSDRITETDILEPRLKPDEGKAPAEREIHQRQRAVSDIHCADDKEVFWHMNRAAFAVGIGIAELERFAGRAFAPERAPKAVERFGTDQDCGASRRNAPSCCLGRRRPGPGEDGQAQVSSAEGKAGGRPAPCPPASCW